VQFAIIIGIMKHRILFIGDRFWGEQNGTPDYIKRELIIKHPQAAWNFHINTHERNTPEYLLRIAPREIIGFQPGFIVFCIGFEYLKQEQKADAFLQHIQHLLDEIIHNCQAQLLFCTMPVCLFPSNVFLQKSMQQINEWILTRDKIYKHLVADFDSQCKPFLQAMQNNSAAQPRSILSENGFLNTLGSTLLGHTILPHMPL
jgi:hypothetical protein